MIEIAGALVLLGAMALHGYTQWLDRVHPKITNAKPSELQDLTKKFESLYEDFQELKLGESFSGRKKPRQTEEDL